MRPEARPQGVGTNSGEQDDRHLGGCAVAENAEGDRGPCHRYREEWTQRGRRDCGATQTRRPVTSALLRRVAVSGRIGEVTLQESLQQLSGVVPVEPPDVLAPGRRYGDAAVVVVE